MVPDCIDPPYALSILRLVGMSNPINGMRGRAEDWFLSVRRKNPAFS